MAYPQETFGKLSWLTPNPKSFRYKKLKYPERSVAAVEALAPEDSVCELGAREFLLKENRFVVSLCSNFVDPPFCVEDVVFPFVRLVGGAFYYELYDSVTHTSDLFSPDGCPFLDCLYEDYLSFPFPDEDDKFDFSFSVVD